ncbi:hypothetical protein AB0E56_10435 [Microbacterium sp. NPDC028030]|uniref:hypothetical protein n=1 Tax=Microbacterium sp. NPDC028030 TaxID=3155124 RepID=UPI0033EE2523
MADIRTDEARDTALVTGAHRLVRMLDASEGPFAGALVTCGGTVAVRRDADDLAGWAGWRFAGSEHIAAPTDVIRRAGGHEVLLPWCTERVSAFVVRRTAADAPLTPGESTTLVISMLRGLDEIGVGVEGVRGGEWWLTDGGRPVFVFGTGTDARAGAEEIVARLAEHSFDKVMVRALGVVERALQSSAGQPRVPRKLLEAGELELLNVAAPQPLDLGRRAPEAPTEVAHALRPREQTSPRAELRRRSGTGATTGSLGRGALALQAGVGAVVARAEELFRFAWRSRRASQKAGTGPADMRRGRRRRSMIIAGTAAAAVLVGGLLWPTGGAEGAPSDASHRAAADTRSGAADTAGHPDGARADQSDAGAGTSEDSAVATLPVASPTDPSPEIAAAALLETIAGCRAREDETCADGVAAGAQGVVAALGAAADAAPGIELVDEYGDVAVVRLVVDPSAEGNADADTAGRLMVVLIRAEEKWLVRDVYDVADQPG